MLHGKEGRNQGRWNCQSFKYLRIQKTVFTWDSYPGEEREDLKNPPQRVLCSHDKPN